MVRLDGWYVRLIDASRILTGVDGAENNKAAMGRGARG